MSKGQNISLFTLSSWPWLPGEGPSLTVWVEGYTQTLLAKLGRPAGCQYHAKRPINGKKSHKNCDLFINLLCMALASCRRYKFGSVDGVYSVLVNANETTATSVQFSAREEGYASI